MLTALVSPVPLDLGFRPATERAGATSQRCVRRCAPFPMVRAHIAGFEVKAAMAKANPAAAASPSRCGAMMEHAQLGEALSDADRAFLRTQCR